MRVGVRGKSSGEVTEYAGNRLDVHAILQGDGDEGHEI